MKKRKVMAFEDSVMVLENEKGLCLVMVRFPDGRTYVLKDVPVDFVTTKVYCFVASKGIRAERWMLKGWEEWLRAVKSWKDAMQAFIEERKQPQGEEVSEGQGRESSSAQEKGSADSIAREMCSWSPG